MIFIIQNDPAVPSGTIAEYLRTRNVGFRTVRMFSGEHLPPRDNVSAVVVLGGGMGVNDNERHPFLNEMRHWIRGMVAAGVPYLGICLGGQLLAAAHGGGVKAGRWGEEGMGMVELTGDGERDTLFAGINPQFEMFQWHHDSFDIPPGGILLAGSPDCRHQAFRIGATAWGIQFHPEVTEDIIRSWCNLGGKGSACTAEILTAWRSRKELSRAVSQQLFRNFLRVVR